MFQQDRGEFLWLVWLQVGDADGGNVINYVNASLDISIFYVQGTYQIFHLN